VAAVAAAAARAATSFCAVRSETAALAVSESLDICDGVDSGGCAVDGSPLTARYLATSVTTVCFGRNRLPFSVRNRLALKGLRAYQDADRAAPLAPMPVVAERLGARLRDYGGTGAPVVFIPSLINPPNILDLSEERSLLRWLAGHGHHVLLVDWGLDVARRASLSIGEHVEEVLLPLVAALDEPPIFVGYCLGGTMAAAAAQLTASRGLATLAAPWFFSAYPDESRALLAHLWAAAQPALAALGVLPMEVLQSAFWSLDPSRTVGKFEAFADMAPGSSEARSFITLEDWANDGPPLPEAAARELFEAFQRKRELLALLEGCARSPGVRLFIGEESGFEPLKGYSLVSAPYGSEGHVLGAIGVIGPTRMAYHSVIPVVQATAKLLTDALRTPE